MRRRQGGIAAFIDAEHALDPDYAKKLGCDTDALLVSQPDTGEQALEIADMLIRSGAIDIVVIDSVAALVPKAEIEGEMGDSHVGLQARLMSQALRKITGALSQTKTTAIFINQLREKVGVMFGCRRPAETPAHSSADGTSGRRTARSATSGKDVKVVKNKCPRGDTCLRSGPGTDSPDRGNVDEGLQFNVAMSAERTAGRVAATRGPSWFARLADGARPVS